MRPRFSCFAPEPLPKAKGGIAMIHTILRSTALGKFLTLFISCIALLSAVPAMAASPPLTFDQALEAARQHKGGLKDSAAINDKLFRPAMSSDVNFVTFDGTTSFKANLVCRSDAPVVRVTAFPVGNVQSIGELNLKVEYDQDLDGVLEGSLTVNNVGGMCGNGFVKGCSPSGSWRKCRFCQWTLEHGVLKEKCDLGNAAQAAPIGPQGMRGCFCFNASCGAPVMGMLENILSFAAAGVLDLLRRQNNTMVVTKSDYQPETLSLSYLGAKVSNCEQSGNDASIAGLTGLVGKFDFPGGQALAEAEASPAHPYNAVVAQYGNDSGSAAKCVIQAKVGVENRRVEREVLLNFGIGVDADGGSKQCYWFRNDYCGTVFGETRYLDVCIGRIIPAALTSLCNQFVVNAGLLHELTVVRDYRPTSGRGNYIGCYGSEDNWDDQLWEVKCRGKRQDDVFICKSPSMGEEGKTIRNDPYNAALWQGCDEILEAENSCKQLEARRMAGECSLHSEVVDGVFTFRAGASTGLQPAKSCRNTTGQNRNITVCEPFWRKERVYSCTGPKTDWSDIKERAKHIGGNIAYDEGSATWTGQGDLVRDEQGNRVTKVFDPNLAFLQNGKTCIPACRVSVPGKVTDLFIPGQGKLAADGSYHMPYDGELSYTLNRDTVTQSVRECEEDKAEKYTCPLLPGETMVAGCECFDKGAFEQVVSSLAAVDLAATNMICSTGNDVGVCTVEDAGGIPEAQVLCGDVTAASEKDLKPCLPKLWKGPRIANQTHVVAITDQYRCNVSAPDLPEDDHFDNDLGSLIPQPAWFDEGVKSALIAITSALQTDPAMIPDPEPGCLCAGARCSWVSQVDTNAVRRNNAITLQVDHTEPFGAVYLDLVQTGFWRGRRGPRPFQCGTHTRNFQFRLAVRKADSGGFVYSLDQTKPEPKHLKTWAFSPNEPLRQCVQRYTEPYADFTDPATKAKFKATYLDLLAYQVAASRNELPRDGQTWSLPQYPPTYRPMYSHGGMGTSILPNIPMFLSRAVSPAYQADTWPGKATLAVTSLIPHAYYYECPLSAPVKSATNSCGATPPFGGVDQTINGPYCFRHRCDAQAVMEPNKPFSGCGMVNDAAWQ